VRETIPSSGPVLLTHNVMVSKPIHPHKEQTNVTGDQGTPRGRREGNRQQEGMEGRVHHWAFCTVTDWNCRNSSIFIASPPATPDYAESYRQRPVHLRIVGARKESAAHKTPRRTPNVNVMEIVSGVAHHADLLDQASLLSPGTDIIPAYPPQLSSGPRTASRQRVTSRSRTWRDLPRTPSGLAQRFPAIQVLDD